MPQYWGGPYRIRTFLRSNLPWFVINTGVIDKGENCQEAGGEHEWYNIDNFSSACYHCSIEKKGELWLKGVFKLYQGNNESVYKTMESALDEADRFLTSESYLRIEAIDGDEAGSWWAYEHENQKWFRS